MICSCGGFVSKDLLPRLVAADPTVGLERPRPLVLERLETDEVQTVGPVGHRDSYLCASSTSIDRFRRQVLVVHVVNHHHRRAVAGREAFLLLLEEETPVWRAFPHLDSKPALDVREQLLAAAEHARDIGAHGDVVPSDRLRLEHRVEGRDLVDLDRRQTEICRDRVHAVLRQVTVLMLQRVQRRDHGRAAPVRGKLCDPTIDLRAHFGGERCGRERRSRRSSIDLSENDVRGADNRHDVREHVTLDHFVERRQMRENRARGT